MDITDVNVVANPADDDILIQMGQDVLERSIPAQLHWNWSKTSLNPITPTLPDAALPVDIGQWIGGLGGSAKPLSPDKLSPPEKTALTTVKYCTHLKLGT